MEISILVFLFLIGVGHGRLSDHFINWLDENHYGDFDFQRDDIGGLSYGGKDNDDDQIVNEPVVFVHGTTGNATNWLLTRQLLLTQGYKTSEIYATTWGSPDPSVLPDQHPDKKNIMHVRNFVEAVLHYTGAEKIDVVAHSMGVTISRAVIKGGTQWDNGTYFVGQPLTGYVDTYVGIAGYNRGNLYCVTNPTIPLCNKRSGFFPGIMIGNEVVGRSELLESLLKEPGFEGDYVYSIYSLQDPAMPPGNTIYCERTSKIPEQTAEIVFDSPEYTHAGVVLLTAKEQHALITNHEVVS